MKKLIERIIPRPANPGMVGDGFRVYNMIPGAGISQQRISPFLMLDFNAEFDFGPSEKVRGVDVHPHKGFETVTIAYKGSVAHHDSTGNSGVINPGDVQWMTAASGISHKEYHEKEFAKKGGFFEMVQIWVNLPKKYKMTSPKYQAVLHEQKGNVPLENGKGNIFVIAGEYNGVKGAAKTFSPIEMYDIRLDENGEAELNLPASFNTGLLVVEGEILINENTKAAAHQYVQFKNEEGNIEIKATKKSVLLLLSGEPINEPIAAYGPFVMNTIEEIQEAVDDFNNGKFGKIA